MAIQFTEGDTLPSEGYGNYGALGWPGGNALTVFGMEPRDEVGLVADAGWGVFLAWLAFRPALPWWARALLGLGAAGQGLDVVARIRERMEIKRATGR